LTSHCAAKRRESHARNHFPVLLPILILILIPVPSKNRDAPDAANDDAQNETADCPALALANGTKPNTVVALDAIFFA
jgi:hypothetical protein